MIVLICGLLLKKDVVQQLHWSKVTHHNHSLPRSNGPEEAECELQVSCLCRIDQRQAWMSKQGLGWGHSLPSSVLGPT